MYSSIHSVQRGGPPVTHDDAFLEDVAEHPDDDAPRLIYADWLEDHDDRDRAEFIRVQCERAHLHREDPRGEELERREQQLLREHGEEWAADFRPYVTDWQFRRGL